MVACGRGEDGVTPLAEKRARVAPLVLWLLLPHLLQVSPSAPSWKDKDI